MTASNEGTSATTFTAGPDGGYSHRPIVWGTRAMVGGGTQLTAQVGMRILWKGGNAVDAAVARALAAGVMEPTAHYSLGGEVAFLFYDRSAGAVRSVDILAESTLPDQSSRSGFYSGFTSSTPMSSSYPTIRLPLPLTAALVAPSPL